MKKWFAIALLVIITGGILYITLVPRVYQKQITVNAPFARLYKQFADINNFKNWYAPFTTTDTAAVKVTGKDKISNGQFSLQITTLNERSCLLRITDKNQSAEILYSIVLDTTHKNTVTLLYKSTMWNKLFSKKTILEDAEKSLQLLKTFTEDTRQVYGYFISMTEVVDTTFLFTSKVVANSKKQLSIKELYQLLTSYAAAKDAGYTGTKIFYTTPAGNDSTRLYQSIGISKNTLQLPVYGPVSVKRMPYKKNLIVADYEGTLGDIASVFAALEQFSIDDNMISMAIPFIKFDGAETDFDDNKIIKAKAYFPVR